MKRLFYGGDILTMVNEKDSPEAVVTSDGKIIFVGELKKAREVAGDDCIETDLAGRTLMPSFIDGHSHIFMYSQFASFPDISGCTNFDEIVEYLKNYLSEHPLTKDDLLIATGYDHNFLDEGTHPTKDILDKISTEVPIYLYHSSGHMAVVNSAIINQYGLSMTAPDPAGGHYGRYPDGTLNGYLEELPAYGPILASFFPRLKQNPFEQMKNVQQVYLRNGVTTAQDGATSREVFNTLSLMAEKDLLKLDVVAYIMAEEHPEEIAPLHSDYYKHLKIGGAKLLLDGSPQGKSAWMSEPYEGEKEYRGYPTHSDEDVKNAALCAIENGYQLLAHANGDAASGQLIDCYTRALAEAKNPKADLRPVMIHCQTVRADQLVQMKEIGMLPSIFVAHTHYWGDVHLKNLGLKRASNISPVKTALDLGLKYNFHQDCPVLPPDMLQTIWCAVNRKTRKGIVIGADQKVSAFDALKGITINAAYAYHEEALKGTIEAGKLADLVILDANPLKVPSEKINTIKVLETIKEGVTLFELN